MPAPPKTKGFGHRHPRRGVGFCEESGHAPSLRPHASRKLWFPPPAHRGSAPRFRACTPGSTPHTVVPHPTPSPWFRTPTPHAVAGDYAGGRRFQPDSPSPASISCCRVVQIALRQALTRGRNHVMRGKNGAGSAPVQGYQVQLWRWARPPSRPTKREGSIPREFTPDA